MNKKKLIWNNYFSPSKGFISLRMTNKINLQIVEENS